MLQLSLRTKLRNNKPGRPTLGFTINRDVEYRQVHSLKVFLSSGADHIKLASYRCLGAVLSPWPCKLLTAVHVPLQTLLCKGRQGCCLLLGFPDVSSYCEGHT